MRNYISELLYEYRTISIPGLGGFEAYYKPASIDHVQGMIYPPSKELKFNRNLKINDGILIDYISQQKNISTTDAKRQVGVWVEEMNGMLERREMLEFPNVGRLYRDYEGNYQFLQDNTNYNRDVFGLPGIQFHPISRNRAASRQEAPQPQASSHATVLTLENQNSKGNVVTTWAKNSAPYLMTALLMIIAVSIFWLNRDSTSPNADAALTVPVSVPAADRLNTKPIRTEDEEDLIETTIVDEIAEKPIIEEKAKPSKKKPPVVEEKVDTEAATLAPGQKESIIILGSFGNAKNAEKYIQSIYYAGYEPFSTKQDGLTKVGVRFGYSDMDEVAKMKRELAKEFKVSAWVMKPKK